MLFASEACRRLLGAGALLLLSVGSAGAQERPTFDVVLRNGTVFDGTGHAGVQADVAVSGGYIAAVGDLTGARARIDIDARGLYVAPGFINFHDHSEADALPTAANLLLQGVTTSIVNPDGGGTTDVGAQLADYGSRPLAINVGGSIGFNAVWEAVVGEKDRRASVVEIARMRGLIEANLRHGAWNVSAGMDYKPAYYASVDEVESVIGVAAPFRTTFPNHDRLTPETNFSSLHGMGETITIAEQAGLTPEVTHMKLQGHEQGSAGVMLERMKAGGAHGRSVPADVYPYLAGQTGLADLIIPGWALDGGRAAFLQRLTDPLQRARIVKEAEEAMNARFNGAQGVYVIEIGEPLTRVMAERHLSAGAAVIQLLERQEMNAILSFGRESDLIEILKYPAAAIACDCGASLNTAVHPRYYGTFPRVLGHYVREERALSWEDAIRKMTGLPATLLGMIDQGYVMPGMAANVTVFDPGTIAARSSYERPTELPEGVRFVLVNGELAVRDGKVTGRTAGHVLLRASDMPSRSESIGKRALRAHGRVLGPASAVPVSIAVEMLQDASDRHARGRFSVTDNLGRVLLETDSMGLLQTTDRWGSFTAYVPSRGAVSLVVDEADPLHRGVKWVRIRVGGKVVYEGALSR
jgi:N-acyl-D-amino-acid deacylase